MSEQPRTINYRFYISLGLIVIGISLMLFVLDSYTIEMAVVPAPCLVILSENYEIPDNVITKGYEVIRDDNGTMTDRNCYYLKNAGMIERGFYGWTIYEQ